MAALPEVFGLREVRDPISTPGVRTRQLTWVTPRLAPERDPVTDRPALDRQRWAVATALAHRKTTMPMDVRHGQTVPGVLKARTGVALVSHLVRLVRCPSATRPHSRGERSSGLDALRGLGAPRTRTP